MSYFKCKDPALHTVDLTSLSLRPIIAKFEHHSKIKNYELAIAIVTYICKYHTVLCTTFSKCVCFIFKKAVKTNFVTCVVTAPITLAINTYLISNRLSI